MFKYSATTGLWHANSTLLTTSHLVPLVQLCSSARRLPQTRAVLASAPLPLCRSRAPSAASDSCRKHSDPLGEEWILETHPYITAAFFLPQDATIH